MRLYRIAREEVEGYIERPELEQIDRGKRVAWARREGLFIKVVYSREKGDVIVITVIPKSTPPEGLR